MKIANVIHDSDLIKHKPVDIINYFNKPIKFDEIENDLPTLYVGWEFLKKIHDGTILENHLTVLNKTIIEYKFYWECSFSEDKQQHVGGVNEFVLSSPYIYFESKYKFNRVDPVFSKIKTAYDLKSILPVNVDKIYIYKDNRLYIKSKNEIFGVDLNMFEFFGLSRFLILDIIKSSYPKVDIFNDTEGVEYKKMYEKYLNFSNLMRYMPVIL